MSRVDVVMPVRNAPNVLALTLSNLWAYALPSGLIRSVTLMDNASTDPAMAPLLDYAARVPNHHVFVHEQNVGVWTSINRGLANTTADLVMVLMADMLIGPGLVETLVEAQRQTGCVMVAPDNGCWGMNRLTEIFPARDSKLSLRPDYNGGCWLLDWPTVREHIGWYDPRFYICAGDVDMVERLWTKAHETQDARWNPHCIKGLDVCHLDKQSRRAEATAQGDAEMEVRDLGRLHEKWRDTRPDICARHPMPTIEGQLAYKARDGGWDEGKVGA